MTIAVPQRRGRAEGTAGVRRAVHPATYDRAENERLLADYARTGDFVLRDQVAGRYDHLAASLARRFARRDSPEDLLQVARVGLLHAIDRFDPGMGRPFPAFARATITGELKRHLRDNTWRVHVPRSLQERYLEVHGWREDMCRELKRHPGAGEVADRTGLSRDQVIEALDVGQGRRPASLEGSGPRGTPIDVGSDDRRLTQREDAVLVDQLMAELSAQDQEVLRLRFWDELTQYEIAERLGVSQMQVSRLLARIVHRMRTRVSAA